MSILQVIPITGGLGSENEKGEAEYTRLFRVVTSSGNVGSLAVRIANGIPKIGDTYGTDTEFDSSSVCKRVQPQQDGENPRLWEVRVEYGPPDEDSQQQNPNPLLRPAVISWSFTKNQRIVWKDVNGKPVMNSALEYFDPPPDMDDSRPLLTITRNEAAFNPAIAINYQDAVNSDSFLGFSPGQAKIAGISASNQTENNYSFWQVTYEFEFRREGWKLQILDQGRNAIFKDLDTQEEFIAPIWQKTRDGKEIQNLPVTGAARWQWQRNEEPDAGYGQVQVIRRLQICGVRAAGAAVAAANSRIPRRVGTLPAAIFFLWSIYGSKYDPRSPDPRRRPASRRAHYPRQRIESREAAA